MSLNVMSNYAANVAHRNLTASDSEMTRSLAKLSSGSRVVSARDDAAAMAIGSRISSEVAALKQANVNAGQASSMLQIADGAMSNVNDILTRMKTLGVQASSGQISNTERSMLDTEYQSLLKEIDRIAQDTEFNGNKLVAGGEADLAGVAALDAVVGLDSIKIGGERTIRIGYVAADDELTVTDFTSGSAGLTQTITLTADQLANGGSIRFDDVDVTIELGDDFADTDFGATDGTTDIDGVANADFKFKLGTGTTENVDSVTFGIGGISTGALGVLGTSIDTAANADEAITAIGNAINTLNTNRANVGASQNRLEFAASNLASTIENQEAARSALLDLDVAAEMTKFTSKQILMQAGVSMLAQANQMPQQLTRLFG